MQNKTCSKCKRSLPVSDFNKAKNGMFGVRSQCKNCQRLYLISWKVEKGIAEPKQLETVKAKQERENYQKEHPELKFCFKCQNWLDRKSFTLLSKSPDGLQVTCRNCRKQHREENTNHYKTSSKKRREANREAINRKHREYRKNNLEKVRASVRSHYQNNKEYYLLNSKKRKALKSQAQGSYSNEQWQAKIQYFGRKCYLCGKDLSKEVIHAEHRKPLSRGGRVLRILCKWQQSTFIKSEDYLCRLHLRF